jgi:hypothetical protein
MSGTSLSRAASLSVSKENPRRRNLLYRAGSSALFLSKRLPPFGYPSLGLIMGNNASRINISKSTAHLLADDQMVLDLLERGIIR